MAFSPITSWQIEGENVKAVTAFNFGGLPNHCGWWLQPWNLKKFLVLGRKAMTNLDNILKSKVITLPAKACIVKVTVFLVGVYGYEIWTINNAEHLNIHTFELWCWRKLLRVPWMARRSNQSILKEVNPECSLEGLLLKLQYLGHQMWRADSLEETLMLGKIEGKRRRGWQRMRLLDGITNSINKSEQTLGSSEVQGSLGCYSPWVHKESDTTSVQFSHSVMSDCLRPHGLQHTRFPCPSPTPRAYSNSCPSSRWCYPNISSSVIPFSSHL